LTDESNELAFSAASLWEIVIKRGLERADFRVDARRLRRALIDHHYTELAITGAHALAIEALPPIHKDPFDRLLVAQALVERIVLATSDAALAEYPGSIRVV
jgi:PIN domain nuclease of toxin-antitoxin system